MATLFLSVVISAFLKYRHMANYADIGITPHLR